MTEAWLSAAEVAGLPGYPGSEFRTRAKLQREGVPSRLRQGQPGRSGREYDAHALQPAARAALMLAQIDAEPMKVVTTPAPAANNAVTTPPATRRPPSRQDSACADARAVVLRHLADLTQQMGGVTRAAQQLSTSLADGTAAPELMAAAQVAHQRARSAKGGTGLSLGVRTLFEWHTAQQQGGWAALLPVAVQPTPVVALPEDVVAVLRRYASTSGAARNLTQVARDVNVELGRPFDDWAALYNRCRRALPKVDKVRLIKARHTGAQRAAKLPFKRRDTSTIAPLDVWLIDGHTAKLKVRHPDHGAPFAPEVTAVIDAATRKITGWSISLSENTIAVGDALRHAVGQHGVPAMVYSDNGAGERAKVFDCPVVGLFERLGVDHRTGIPGHPQGHGLIERSWQTHMLRCARRFATYQGGDVDDRTLRNVTAELAKEQRALKRAETGSTVVRLSAKCPSWAQFIDAVAQEVEAYNSSHRHRGLPKHTSGPHAGKHMTPDEAWAAMLVPADQVMLDAAALRHIFMPAVLRTAQRGEVRFLNQHYYATDLMQHDGEQVRVHYDIHDGGRVWVWGLDGRFICEAQWGANKMGYMPAPAVDIARQKRVAGMVKRREAQIDTALAELGTTVPAAALPQPDMPVFIGDGLHQVPRSVPTPVPMPARQPLELVERTDDTPDAGRPFFDGTAARYEWLMQHRAAWSAGDAAWLAAYAAGPEYEALAEYFTSRGLHWPDDPQVFESAG